jgi:hypothetical protein
VRENADTTRSFSKPSTVKVAQGVSGNMGSVMDFLLHSPVMSQHSLQDLGVRNVQGLPAGVNAGRVRFESRTGSAQVRAEPEGDARRTQRAPVGRITSPTTILFRAATRLTSLSQDSIRTSGQLCPIKRSRLRSTRAVTLTAQFSRVAAAVAASSRGTTALSTWSPASSNAGSFGPPVIPHNAPSGSYLFGMTPPRFNSYYRSTLSDNPFPTPVNESGDPDSPMLTRSCGCCRVLSWNYCPEHWVRASNAGSSPSGIPPPRFNSDYRSTPYDNLFPTPANEGGDPGSSMLTRSCGCCRVLSWNYCPEHLVCTDLPHRSPEYMRRTRNVGLGTTLGKGSMYPSPGGSVKFRLSSQTRSGISVTQALNRERLSQLHGYKLPDFSPDTLNKITLRVRVRCLPSPLPLH